MFVDLQRLAISLRSDEGFGILGHCQDIIVNAGELGDQTGGLFKAVRARIGLEQGPESVRVAVKISDLTERFDGSSEVASLQCGSALQHKCIAVSRFQL